MKITKLDRKYRGIVLIILSALFFAAMSMLVRLSGDLPVLQKCFFRNAVALLVATVLLVRKGYGFRPTHRENLPWLLTRACFGTISTLCNFYAVDQLLLADASILNKMSPFFAVIISALLLKEKLSPLQGFTLAGAFVGALCIVKPTLSNMNLIPALVGLTSGFCAGVGFTLVRLLGQRGEKNSYIVFVFSAVSCAATLPKLLFDFTPMTWQQVVCLVCAGACAAVGQFCVTGAYGYAPAREISVYDYSQVIFSATMGFFLFGDVPDRYSVLGYFLICGMAVLNFWYSTRYLPRKQAKE